MSLRGRFALGFAALAGIGPLVAVGVLHLLRPAEPVGPVLVALLLTMLPLSLLLSLLLGRAIAELQAAMKTRAEQQFLEGEMKVARQIQTSMLPRTLNARGLEVSARTLAAEEVGGDYYDVLPTADGAWIGIGDVAGHGLPAGIIMLTIQSAIAALTQDRPGAGPKQILDPLNRVIFENIHHRLEIYEFVTLSLIRFFRDGRIVVAGAHEDIIVYRASTGRCDSLPTSGTWIGVVEDISSVTSDEEHRLEPGDVMVLYTDGVTEAEDGNGQAFGFERLTEAVAAMGREPTEQIVSHVMAAVKAWSPRLADDVSVVALRYLGPG
ncbi:MAG TPA: PP2C family protein-serine/threonine phosphatase [Polyangia bacterium]|nr:PP2C family protein-serine/threonine phosphatase [Polyangia bacterium]